jgi:hypothetical protein
MVFGDNDGAPEPPAGGKPPAGEETRRPKLKVVK